MDFIINSFGAITIDLPSAPQWQSDKCHPGDMGFPEGALNAAGLTMKPLRKAPDIWYESNLEHILTTSQKLNIRLIQTWITMIPVHRFMNQQIVNNMQIDEIITWHIYHLLSLCSLFHI